MALEQISFYGERSVWLDFTHKVRKRRNQKVWDVLKPFIEAYQEHNEEETK